MWKDSVEQLNTVFLNSSLKQAYKVDRQRKRDRNREKALIKHDCMIFQPQRAEHRKARSQSSSWGSEQGKGNSHLQLAQHCSALVYALGIICIIFCILPQASLTLCSALSFMPLFPFLFLFCFRLKVREGLQTQAKAEELSLFYFCRRWRWWR